MSSYQNIGTEIMSEFPWPKSDANKHSRGRLAVFSGDYLNTGASRLAANAGARIGAGWVKIFAPPKACEIIAVHETSIMACDYERGAPLPSEIGAFDSAVIGMALGQDAKAMAIIDRLMDTKLSLVLDADALNLIKSEAGFFERIKARAEAVIFTPHEGEFMRLFDCQKSTDLDEKIAQTKEAARKSGAIIVHKGQFTVIAAPDGAAYCLKDAPAVLATMGSGDVLAGLIAGLLAQGVSPMKAAILAAFVHSRAAIEFGHGLIAQDLLSKIPDVLNIYGPKLK